MKLAERRESYNMWTTWRVVQLTIKERECGIRTRDPLALMAYLSGWWMWLLIAAKLGYRRMMLYKFTIVAIGFDNRL